ncbi:MAG: cytochrome c peroxidase [Rubricoccaceae bacterium]|nr:cytochrome c peroxidase [Rubricoccaceae bacterium]
MKALLCFALLVTVVAMQRDPLLDHLPEPVTDADYYDDGAPPEARVELGRLLFFDKILSGNQNISCATCHHPDFAGGDGLALGFGEGPSGLGPDRRPGQDAYGAVHERVPRNAPALFNLGAREFTRLFHDGRVELDTAGFYESGFITPARWKLPMGLDNVLAAQALFPVTSPTEMTGQRGENPVIEARSLNNVAGPGGVWAQLADRLRAVPEYVALFQTAFPDEVASAEDITMVHAANAIAAFEATAFRADDSSFDRYLRTGRGLSAEAERGLRLFYGGAGCASCHSGPFQTDHDDHAIAMPQIGPGKGDGSDASYWRATGLRGFPEDLGRGRVTRDTADDYRFRTPSLRNVALTAPYGHSGAYATLDAVVRHHLDPVASLEAYEIPEGLLPPLDYVLEQTADGPRLETRPLSDERREAYLARDTWVQNQPALRARIAAANELAPVALTDAEVDDLLAFLHALTDPASRDLSHLVPEEVPSGLPVRD